MSPIVDDFPSIYSQHNGEYFLTPTDLSEQPTKPKRVLVVGSCLAEAWKSAIDCPCDFVLTNNVSVFPENPPAPIEHYDLQLVQLPLRSIMPDATLWGLSFRDLASHEKAFEDSLQRLRHYLRTCLGWNTKHKILTFCVNFLVPQQNPMGRFAPRYDLRNPVFFVEQLNFHLAEELKNYGNVQFLDINEISSSFGKKFIQDDSVEVMSHGAVLGDFGYARDIDRFEPILRMTQHYKLCRESFLSAVWHQAASMYKTLRQDDAVKLVIVDLDNTLWRGVIAEGAELDGFTNEGWPLGVVEALAYLKKRGVILAIASQNNESTIRALWPQIFHGRFALEDFAIVRINWSPKIDNIDEILACANVLPRHTVFIDDNPVERSRVQSMFPDMRVLGKYPYYLKRILLWSPELQIPIITEESAIRTELVRAQVTRRHMRQEMSREEFLISLDIKVDTTEVLSADHPDFPRALELINKTNQFNTSGRRWTREECEEHFRRRNGIFVFSVKDRLSDYGVVGCAIVSLNHIQQFVMSCRVIGLDIEKTVISVLEARIAAVGGKEIYAHLVETKDNFPCRDLFGRCGFKLVDGIWVKTLLAGEAFQAHAG
jgi:FkbH-like protein